jgi:hypothetical protein
MVVVVVAVGWKGLKARAAVCEVESVVMVVVFLAAAAPAPATIIKAAAVAAPAIHFESLNNTDISSLQERFRLLCPWRLRFRIQAQAHNATFFEGESAGRSIFSGNYTVPTRGSAAFSIQSTQLAYLPLR